MVSNLKQKIIEISISSGCMNEDDVEAVEIAVKSESYTASVNPPWPIVGIAFIATLIRCILLVDSREEFLWLWILDTIILLLNAYHFASFALQTCLYLILKFFYLPTFGHCLKIHAKYCSTSKMAIQCILEKNAIVQKLFRLESSTPKTCCNLQQLEFNSLRNNILQLRSMSETLFTQFTDCPSNCYMASMPLSDYGQLFEENVESFSLSALKELHRLYELHFSEFVRLILCLHIHAANLLTVARACWKLYRSFAFRLEFDADKLFTSYCLHAKQLKKPLCESSSKPSSLLINTRNIRLNCELVYERLKIIEDIASDGESVQKEKSASPLYEEFRTLNASTQQCYVQTMRLLEHDLYSWLDNVHHVLGIIEPGKALLRQPTERNEHQMKPSNEDETQSGFCQLVSEDYEQNIIDQVFEAECNERDNFRLVVDNDDDGYSMQLMEQQKLKTASRQMIDELKLAITPKAVDFASREAAALNRVKEQNSEPSVNASVSPSASQTVNCSQTAAGSPENDGSIEDNVTSKPAISASSHSSVNCLPNNIQGSSITSDNHSVAGARSVSSGEIDRQEQFDDDDRQQSVGMLPVPFGLKKSLLLEVRKRPELCFDTFGDSGSESDNDLE